MVLLPGPAMGPVMSGPPSAFALSMRPWLLAVFLLFIPVAVARFIVVDVIGGIFLLLTAGIGWYALKGSMDISWLLCLAIILFMNGIFDAIILAARASDTHYPLFGEKLPVETNVVHGLLCIGPLVEMVSALICWRIYRDHIANILGEDGEFIGMENGGLGPVAGGDQGGLLAARTNTFGGARGSQTMGQSPTDAGNTERRSGFEAFQGEGHRLSD